MPDMIALGADDVDAVFFTGVGIALNVEVRANSVKCCITDSSRKIVSTEARGSMPFDMCDAPKGTMFGDVRVRDATASNNSKYVR